jgi:hypothetical protein
MKDRLKKILVVATLLSCCATLTQAQDGQGRRQGGGQGGPRDMEEMRQRMSERMREQFAVSDDAEWKIIEAKIQKVTEARRLAGAGGMGPGGAGFARPGGPGGPGGGGQRGGPGGRGGFGGEPLPEVEELRKAVDAKAPSDELKTKMAKVREARKANRAKLEAAQDDLRKVLSVRQEAVAMMSGLLD